MGCERGRVWWKRERVSVGVKEWGGRGRVWGMREWGVRGRENGVREGRSVGCERERGSECWCERVGWERGSVGR